jgi:hypothetical protein
MAATYEDDIEWEAAAWHLERLAALGEKVGPRLERLQEFVRTWHWVPRPEPWEDIKDFVPIDNGRRRAIEESALAARKVTSRGPMIQFATRFPRSAMNVAAYVARRIIAEGPRKIRIRAGSDDAIRIWVNGVPVLAKLVFRGALPDQDEAEADLRPGENVLLVEVSNAGGGWHLYLRLEDSSGRKLRLTDDDRLVPLAGE